MDTIFEDIVKQRINSIEKVAHRFPKEICMTEDEFKFFEREMERNYNYVKEEPPTFTDGTPVKMTNCYEGVEIKIV